MCQRSSRNVIERAFGVLKKRFSVLGPDSRLGCKLDINMAIIVACVVLHNLAIFANEDDDFPQLAVENGNNFDQGEVVAQNTRGNAMRQAIIDRYF